MATTHAPRIRMASMPGYGLMRSFYESVIAATSIGPGLRHLINLRASQINGCAFCLDMHSREAREHGETEQRLYVLSAWREAPFYSERERAALELTEYVTRIGEQGVPDEVYARVREQFSETEYLDLLLLLVSINGWNRLSIATGGTPTERRK